MVSQKESGNSFEELKKEDYFLPIEKLTKRLSLPYMMTFVLIEAVLLFVQALFFFSMNAFDKNVFQFLIWNLTGAISVVLCMTLSRYLRDKTIQHLNKMMVVLKDEQMPILKEQLDITFVKSYNWSLPLAASMLISIPFQVYFLIISPWSSWQLMYQQSYVRTLTLAILAIGGTCVWLFAVASLGYLCICNAALLFSIRKRLKIFSIAEIDKGYIKPLGSQLMTITTCFTVGVGVNLLVAMVAPIAWWTVSQILIFVISTLVLFFVPLFELHVVIVNEKEKAIRNFKERWWDLAGKAKPEVINALRIEELRIEAIQTWPFSGDMLLKVGGYIIIPVFLFLLHYVIGA